jgi:hypothetical protein
VDTTQTRQYVIEFMVDEDSGWQEWYRTPEQADAEAVWRRVLDTKPRGRARLLEVEVLRFTQGEPAQPEPA